MVGLSRVVTVTFTGAGGGLAHDHMTLGQVEVLGDSLAAGLLAQRYVTTTVSWQLACPMRGVEISPGRAGKETGVSHISRG